MSRAIERQIARINLIDLRPFGVGRHHVTDDYPFGGGAGMVMKPEPLFDAVESVPDLAELPVILLSPRGRLLSQSVAEQLSTAPSFLLVAGHYEGVDERVREHLATDEISVGDYVLSCGELAAMVVADCVVRLLPGALADGSSDEESFSAGLLEYPQYTRPAGFRAWETPPVLLSGNHEEIARWRRRQALRTTYKVRPELLASAQMTPAELELVAGWIESDQKPE